MAPSGEHRFEGRPGCRQRRTVLASPGRWLRLLSQRLSWHAARRECFQADRVRARGFSGTGGLKSLDKGAFVGGARCCFRKRRR
jgi:hypothetical protein